MTASSQIAIALVLCSNGANARGIRTAIEAVLPDARFDGKKHDGAPLIGSRGALRFSIMCIDRPAPISPNDPSVHTA